MFVVENDRMCRESAVSVGEVGCVSAKAMQRPVPAAVIQPRTRQSLVSTMPAQCFIRPSMQRSPRYAVHSAQVHSALTWFSPSVETVARGVAAELSPAMWSHRYMNARSDAPLPQPTAQNLVFHPSTVTQGALVGVTSGMQMWSQPTPQAILMTNIAGAANSPTGGTNTTVNNAFIRTPVSSMATASPGATPLIFAASTPDGTGLVRAPLPTQIVTSQLASAASATPPLTSFVLGTPSATPTSAAIVVSNISTPATAAPTTSNTTQPAPVTITSSQSASTVLDQAQPPPSSPMPKVVSFQSVAVESPGTQSVAPTPPSQDSAAVAEVAPPAPALVCYSLAPFH
nr:unnamed protein product [Spirometra erinaceieuropaei]